MFDLLIHGLRGSLVPGQVATVDAGNFYLVPVNYRKTWCVVSNVMSNLSLNISPDIQPNDHDVINFSKFDFTV